VSSGPATPPAVPPHEPELLHPAVFRRSLAGFFLSGVLFSFLGAVLPRWGYHLQGDYVTVGNYFLAIGLGIMVGVSLAHRILRRRSCAWVLTAGCVSAAAAFVFLGLVPPPFSPWWRMGGLFVTGVAGAALYAAVFHSVGAVYEHDPSATANLAGLFLSLGCMVTALWVAVSFYIYTIFSVLFFLALIPAFLAGVLARSQFPAPQPLAHPSLGQVMRDFRSPAAVMFSLLIFFQFGNEYAVAGWLPLFLIQRLGISPESALWLLALFWFALMTGRSVAQFALRRVRRARLLLAAVVADLFGCVVLLATENLFGVITGILLIAAGFAVIFPVLAEQMGGRFPNYHPVFFSGIFSFAMAGGLLAPWSLGYLAQAWGIQAVMGLPLAGSVMVFLLLVLIWIEARLTGPRAFRTG